MSEREYFACVGKTPGMFVGRTSFHMLTSFLIGYDQHAMRHGGTGLAGWHEWLVARRGHGCNHAWPGQVLHIALPDGWENMGDLPPEDETRAIDVLFQLLDEFAAEREGQGQHGELGKTVRSGQVGQSVRSGELGQSVRSGELGQSVRR